MDKLPPDLDDLFGEARRDVGEADRLARVAARLGPALDAPAPPRWSWKSKASLGGSIVLGALVAALPISRRLQGDPAWPATPIATSAAASAASAAPPAPPLDLPAASASATPEPPGPSARPAASAGPSAAASGPARNSGDSLVEEHALLAEARRALGTSPSQALALVQQHQRRFPGGMLSTEREFLRITALSRLGRGAEARAAADRFLAAHRGSPYAAEVERIAGH
jgi:hypothetical protein